MSIFDTMVSRYRYILSLIVTCFVYIKTRVIPSDVKQALCVMDNQKIAVLEGFQFV